MTYGIEIVHAARKQILSLPEQAQKIIAGAIDSLADVPRPSSCKKLRGTDLCRVRIERYRVVYAIDDKARMITILKVALRREDTYQGL